jgi:hypothetical protein
VKTAIICRNEALKRRAISLIEGLPCEDVHEVAIRPFKSKRSIEQNRLMWMWIDLIRVHVGDSTGNFFSGEEVHAWLKEKFLPVRIVDISGTAVKCAATTTKLNTKEMADYLTTIERFCASEMGLFLPIPGMDDD